MGGGAGEGDSASLLWNIHAIGFRILRPSPGLTMYGISTLDGNLADDATRGGQGARNPPLVA